jgi:hypothetical protein
MTSLRHRFATRPSAAQNRPRRRTARGPENESAREGGGKQVGGAALFPFYVEKGVDREKISTRDRDSVIGPAFPEPFDRGTGEV